jgi:glycine dehydrogenase subunit 1
MPYIPHSEQDIIEMLDEVGVDSIDQLYDELPSEIQCDRINDLSDGLTELEVSKLINRTLKKDQVSLNFIGAGAYHHYIPSVVGALASRGEYVTAYTPYQAEVSQGNLQIMFEFQTMIASLCSLEVANASMYDGATALCEAILMSCRIKRENKKHTALISDLIHPNYIEVLSTILRETNVSIVQIPFSGESGVISISTLLKYDSLNVSAVVVPQVNFVGQLTNFHEITDWAHSKGAIAIALVNPMALSSLSPPGEWGELGADIACGEGQPLGIPLSSGGPYFGFMSCKIKYIRQLPGRIVGETIDAKGKTGYVLTLQAREQHIRRSRATSNICTNQGLMVISSSIFMSTMGSKGMRDAVLKSHSNTMKLAGLLDSIPGVSLVYDYNYLYEIVIRLDVSVSKVLAFMVNHKIQAGYDLSVISDYFKGCLLICVTEVFDEEDLTTYIKSMRLAVGEIRLLVEEVVNVDI